MLRREAIDRPNANECPAPPASALIVFQAAQCKRPYSFSICRSIALRARSLRSL
jgi:hypothetical protein